MIEVRHIHRKFGELEVLKGIDMRVERSEILSISGASGAGKTTLLQIIGTLDSADTGEVLYDGENVLKYKPRKLARFRNSNIGFVFQFHHLLPEFTAVENVCIPGYIGGRSKKEVEVKAAELLDRLGLRHRLQHKPGELSGGEQQRVAVARSLINDPMLVLADEPSGNLDSENAKELHDLFFTLRDEIGQTFVIVTHNRELASSADRELVMRDGNIVSETSS